MRLYGTPPTRAIRVQWLLNELGIDCGVVALEPIASDLEFLAINPADELTVLVHGNVVLTESAAIPLCLAEKYPEREGLIPVELVERAQIYRWVVFLVTEIEQPLWRVALNIFIYAKKDRVPADILNAARDCKTMAAVFKKHMANRDLVVGEKLSVIDPLQRMCWMGQTSRLPLELAPSRHKHSSTSGLAPEPFFGRGYDRDVERCYANV